MEIDLGTLLQGKATIIKGKINPIVYIVINKFAVISLLEVEAIIRTDASIGPIQGVHPKLKVNPNINADKEFISFIFIFI